MPGTPQLDHLLTRELLHRLYVKQRLSFPQISEQLTRAGTPVSTSAIHRYARRHGIGRNASESRRNRVPGAPDWDQSYMDEPTIDALDGFLLGDGHCGPVRKGSQVMRLSCALEHEAFCTFMMSPFKQYLGRTTKLLTPREKGFKQGHGYFGRTMSHPDFAIQRSRWYDANGKKPPPDDVRFTPVSVLLWYLGDGSVVVNNDNHTVMLRLSTDGFRPDRVEFLANRLRAMGIAAHRNNDNRIQVDARGLPAFFKLIGRDPPLACYAYKWDLHPTRFDSLRMKDAAKELGVPYQRLADLTKYGHVPCVRYTQKGRPPFRPEDLTAIKSMIDSGEFFVDRRTLPRGS